MIESDFLHKMDMLFGNTPPKKLAIAVSGGADSIALAHLANKYTAKYRNEIIALTVDHNYRDESAAEAKTVAKWMQQAGIAHHILTNEDEKPQKNLMAAARDMRYQLLTGYCNAHNIQHLLIAHHQDDQIETFFLRLERGSGVKGLSCMSEKSTHKNIQLIRPLLDFNKSQLVDYLKQQNITWVEDPTNQNTNFKRNKLRQCLAELFEDDELLNKRICNTIANMRRANETIEALTNRAEEHYVTYQPQGFAEINILAFAQESEDVQLRLLASTLQTISGNAEPIRIEKLNRLLQSISNNPHDVNQHLHGCLLKTHQNALLCIRELAKIPEKTYMLANILWDNRFYINSNLAQAYITPLTAQGANLLPTACKTSLPKAVIYTLPAIKKINNAGVEETLCVPHMNYYAPQCAAEDIKCQFATAKALAASHVD